MRLGCPHCRATLEMPYAPPGADVQCAGCGGQFKHAPPVVRPVQAYAPPVITAVKPGALKPVVIGRRSSARSTTHYPPAGPPVSAPVAIPLSGYTPITTAVPLTDVTPSYGAGYTIAVADDPAPPPRKKKRRRFRRKNTDDADSSTQGWQVIAGIILLLVLIGGGYFFGAGKFGWLRQNKLIDYNNQIVDVVNKFHNTLPQINLGPNDDPVALLSGLANTTRGPLAEALQAVRQIDPPREGKDLHQAVLRYLERCDVFFNQEVAQVIALIQQQREDEVLRLVEQAMNDIDRLEEQMIAAQKKFASDNRLEGLKWPDFNAAQHKPSTRLRPPGMSWPGPSRPGLPQPGQPWRPFGRPPGMQQPGQPVPDQPIPGQPWPRQPRPGQPMPGLPRPAQPGFGQPGPNDPQ